MNILHPESLEAAIEMKLQNPEACYLGGCTAVLSLIGGLGDDASLIDISALVPAGISIGRNGISIGGGAKLSDVADSSSLPGFIRESAAFQSALQLRVQSTIGGNVALSRFDSYMIPSLYACDATLMLLSPTGEKEMKVDEYVLSGDRDSIITSILIPASGDGVVRRFARSSHAHAALTAACMDGRYAYGASGSGFAFGGRDSYGNIRFCDDLTGSGEYKRYLASVAFEEVR